MTSVVVFITGIFIRLVLPIVITVLLVFLLRKLDARWQADAQQARVEKPECWKIKACSLEQREACPAFQSPLPCWQVHRRPNGYLNETCLICKVLIDAPTPELKVDPRRL